MRNNLFRLAFLATCFTACGTTGGMMNPDLDGGEQGTDAMIADSRPMTTDTARSCVTAIDPNNASNPSNRMAAACTQDSECCSGNCENQICSVSNLGGLCATERDCDPIQGTCRNGRCNFMEPGTACTNGGPNDRVMCDCRSGRCTCAPDGVACVQNSDCCGGMTCQGVGATTPGNCR